MKYYIFLILVLIGLWPNGSEGQDTGTSKKELEVSSGLTFQRQQYFDGKISYTKVLNPIFAFRFSKGRITQSFELTGYDVESSHRNLTASNDRYFRFNTILRYGMDYYLVKNGLSKFQPYAGFFIPIFENYFWINDKKDSLPHSRNFEVGTGLGLKVGFNYKVSDRIMIDLNLPFQIFKTAVQFDKYNHANIFSHDYLDKVFLDVVEIRFGLIYRL